MILVRFAAIAALLIATLMLSGCGRDSSYCQSIHSPSVGCPDGFGPGAGAGGSSAGLVCAGNTTIYLCNIENSAYQTPSSPFDPFPMSLCGLGFCANSSDLAKSQAHAYTGVSPTDSRFVCINTGTTTEAGFQALFQAVAQIPGVDPNDFGPLCVMPPGVTACGNPCDDGQGGSLQGPGEHCGNAASGYYCCAGLTCVGYGDTYMGTCQGTLQKCPPPQTPPNWQGLTTTMLRQIANANNINGCASQTGITQSQNIGVTFEKWVLTTMGVYPKPPGPGRNNTLFMSMARQTANMNNGGLPASVIPELVGNQTMFPQSVFFEVKAVTGNLTPGTSRSQILGLLDVANTVPTVPAGPHPPPAVFFITTSNTTVTTGVVSYGTMFNVAVWQQKVLYDPNSATPNNPNLTLGAANCLSPPNLCMASVLENPHPGPTVSPLTAPTTPPSALIVPNDPDPAEVD